MFQSLSQTTAGMTSTQKAVVYGVVLALYVPARLAGIGYRAFRRYFRV